MAREVRIKGIKPTKEALIKLITFMFRQARHEHNQCITVCPEPVEGLNRSYLKQTIIHETFGLNV